MHTSKQVESLTFLFFCFLDVQVLNLTSFSFDSNICFLFFCEMGIAGWSIPVKPSKRNYDIAWLTGGVIILIGVNPTSSLGQKRYWGAMLLLRPPFCSKMDMSSKM
jgi:hypothetical protein